MGRDIKSLQESELFFKRLTSYITTYQSNGGAFADDAGIYTMLGICAKLKKETATRIELAREERMATSEMLCNYCFVEPAVEILGKPICEKCKKKGA